MQVMQVTQVTQVTQVMQVMYTVYTVCTMGHVHHTRCPAKRCGVLLLLVAMCNFPLKGLEAERVGRFPRVSGRRLARRSAEGWVFRPWSSGPELQGALLTPSA